MRSIGTLVLVGLISYIHAHYVSFVGNGQILDPYHYIVHHSIADSTPHDLGNAVGAVSRETLEDQSAEGFLQSIPDIEDVQASLNPDDGQVPEVQGPQRPQLPSAPFPPTARPPHWSGPGPKPAPSGEDPKIIFNGPQPDGSYDFSYNLGDQSRSEKSDGDGNVQGTYSYTGPDGKQVTVTYTAGANKGFIPEGEGLLPPPPVHPDAAEEDQGNSQVPLRPQLPPQYPGSHPGPQPTNGEAPNVIFNGPQPDGSYDFSYNLDDQSRSEKSDANGNVQGSYSYIGPDGKEVAITYTAGANRGYIPAGEGLVPPPPAHPQGAEDEGHSQLPQLPQLPEEDVQQHITPGIPPKRTDTKKHGSPSPAGEDGGSHGGMPYSYNYDAQLSSKTETADDQGNVEGSYTYLDGAGISRTVTYTVKGDEGFIAKGDIHPDPGTADVKPNPRPPGVPSSRPSGGKGWHVSPLSGKGWHTPPPNLPPSGKGRHTPPPPLSPSGKGGNVHPPSGKGIKGGASGWDKYPLGG